MKKLFQLTGPKGKPVKEKGEVVYFDKKHKAKAAREDLGGLGAGFHVSRGPDNTGPHAKPKKWRDDNVD